MTTTDTRSSYTAGLRALADLLDANPGLTDDVAFTNYRMLACVSWAQQPKARMAEWIRAAKAAGLSVSKLYDNEYGNVDIDLGGGLAVQVYAKREQVCERVVTGTREVTEEVPDPDALAAVPKVTVTKTVEDIEWKCSPLLAAEPVSA